MMGFDVGEITRITAEEPHRPENVYIEFIIKGEYIDHVDRLDGPARHR